MLARMPTEVRAHITGTVWKIEKKGGKRGAATLRIDPFAPIPDPDRAALEEEGKRLLAAAHPDAASHGIEFRTPQEASR